MAARNKYLNNKELLKEIHNSKISYSEFNKSEYHRFDAIVETYDDMFTANTLLIAQEAKAKRIAQETYESAITAYSGPANGRPRLIDHKIDPNSLDSKEIIYRVMTFEHIPLEPGRKKNPRKESEHYVKLNFIPFKHYMVTNIEKKKAIEVGRSHSKDGEFCQSHGAMTDKLARMFILLVDRYSQRANWRGYSYVDEMKGQSLLQLSAMGLQFNEQKSNNPFAYYTQALANAFIRVLNIEKKNQNIRDEILINRGLTPSFSKQLEHENKIRQLREDAKAEAEKNN